MKPQLYALFALCLAIGLVVGRLSLFVPLGPLAATQEPASPGSEAFRTALREQDLSKRSLALASFLEHLGPENIDEAVAVLETHRIGVIEYEMKMIMYSWARFDPAGAFAWAKTDDWGRKGMTTQLALYAWGFRDPHGAIEALKQNDGFDSESRSVDAIISGWSRNGDIKGVTDFITSLPASKSRSKQANNLAAILANANIDVAIAWAEGVPVDAPDQFKRVAYMRTMSAVAKRDPERAMRWYEQHQGQAYTEGALDVLARRFIDSTDPVILFDWLQSLPVVTVSQDDSERSSAIGVGFRAWLRKDTEGATLWLKGQPILPLALDPVAAEMARHLMSGRGRKKPAMAIEWSMRIQDPQLRQTTIVSIARKWRGMNAEAMQAWLDTAELTEQTRAVILAKPKKPNTGPARARPTRAKRAQPGA
jgi:hypothetical protein